MRIPVGSSPQSAPVHPLIPAVHWREAAVWLFAAGVLLWLLVCALLSFALPS